MAHPCGRCSSTSCRANHPTHFGSACASSHRLRPATGCSRNRPSRRSGPGSPAGSHQSGGRETTGQRWLMHLRWPESAFIEFVQVFVPIAAHAAHHHSPCSQSLSGSVPRARCPRVADGASAFQVSMCNASRLPCLGAASHGKSCGLRTRTDLSASLQPQKARERPGSDALLVSD